MSRTYRKKNETSHWCTPNWYMYKTMSKEELDLVDQNDIESIQEVHSRWRDKVHYDVKYTRKSEFGKKVLAKFHSDAGVWNFKEPGPSWFKRMTRTVPNRRHTKQELHKFMTREDYEPMVFDFLHKHAEYWT